MVKTLCLWLSLFLLGLSVATMLCRIMMGGNAKNPAKGQDPEIINTLNRIISNTIEQSVIFAGFYGNLLFNVDKNAVEEISSSKVLALASLFVIGRVLFALGYVLCWVTRIPTWRSFGFGVSLITNIIMGLYFLEINVFSTLDSYKYLLQL